MRTAAIASINKWRAATCVNAKAKRSWHCNSDHQLAAERLVVAQRTKILTVADHLMRADWVRSMNCSNASSYKYIGDNIELLSLDRMWSSSDQGPCSSETARWFAELMAAGIPFPPIGVVLFVGDRFHVIDGAHRVGTSKLSVVTARGASKFACRLA